MKERRRVERACQRIKTRKERENFKENQVKRKNKYKFIKRERER